MKINVVAIVTADHNLSDAPTVFDRPQTLWKHLSDLAIRNKRDFEDIDLAQFICSSIFKEAEGHDSYVTFFDNDCEDRCFDNQMTFKITTAHLKS